LDNVLNVDGGDALCLNVSAGCGAEHHAKRAQRASDAFLLDISHERYS
jgi:hypothetical protein